MTTAELLWTGCQTPGPLEGVHDVDFGQFLAGPACAMLLADQGADVIHIDPPGGPRLDSPVNAVLLRGRRHMWVYVGLLPAEEDLNKYNQVNMVCL